MDLKNWVKKLKPQQPAQPLIKMNLPNGTVIPSVTEEVQAPKKSNTLMG